MDSYINGHGGIERKDFLDFSISVNPLKVNWLDKLSLDEIYRYTYIQWLEKEFYKYFGGVIVAGATEAFHIIGYHILNDSYVIIPRPNYSDYFKVAKFSAKIIDTPWYFVNKKLDLNVLEKSIKNARKKSKKVVVFLGNPNNPTGIFLNFSELVRFYEDVIFISDEAFIDFVEDYEEIDYENIIKVRTFTKFFGVPGIRVGYVKSKNYEEVFRQYRMEWGVGGLGYVFLKRLLENIEDFESFRCKTLDYIRIQKHFFKDYMYVESQTNYFLLDVGNIDEFLDFCISREIFVRDARNFGLDLIRVGLKDEKSNIALLKTLKEGRL
ncbi:aminotransferase [Thermosipho melanesiensis]|uniref:histidinol-phosphate transaminase n=2 Tax=Thermosipho melanesiensis TaxID=46541 RepID=A6LLC0_THEM4|nr:aminotransferase class I/II-fold pyridoxal phosphate-dependent enzyme [Thermosipho melanesiensis]ABR30721.1 aminotransferase, class I and II [Thermosipho melanesiensis BI429]APT73850.1 aminotransferase [Thermosipho melanesiensis]OOC35790.1 aminotransferase [Thermosipho melanesiensis]OOC38292.1 aminotransferase [Thermosipho melanesiensis]OOC38753.1 aminotransferase [Thermosipho melanesiensis]